MGFEIKKSVRLLGRVRKETSVILAACFIVLAGASAAFAQTVTVTAEWDPNTDQYTAGYRLYYGTSSGNYTWSVDAGNQVTKAVSLSQGSIYYFTVRAYNSSSQYGPNSAEVSINLTQPPPPPPPTAPTAQITATLQSPNTALVTWQTTNATAASINGTSVALSGSSSVGISATTTYTLTATGPNGTATASATVTVAGPAAPGAPPNMASSTSGSRATLSWSAPTTGGSPTDYRLDVGTSPGGTDVTNGLSVGNVLTVAGDLQRGRYYARVRAANAVGVSPHSNETQFRIGRRLTTPGGFTVTWSGTVATLSWTASGAATAEDVPTGYVIEAGSAPGLSDVATIPVGNVTSFQADVPSGVYYVRVRAVNDLGDSDPSTEVVVRAPGAPQAPTSLSASGIGANVDLQWTAPNGPPPTGYVLEAGSAPGRSDLAVLTLGNVTQFSTVAPPGVYYVRVRAVNARGSGDPSNEIVVRR